MKLAQALQAATFTLERNGIEESHHEARILLQNILNLSSSAEIYSHPELELSRTAIKRLQHLIERRVNREPNAYIVKNKEFYGANFYVDHRVMVPRPETEILVEQALAFVKYRNSHLPFYTRHPVIADIGTGSGAIAISITLNFPDVRVYATDCSPSAIKVAKVNCRNHKVNERITILQGNLLEPIPEMLDLIVANLPYVRSSDLTRLEPEIINFEPKSALDGGQDGLKHIRNLIIQAKIRMHPKGCILLEIGDKQDDKAVAIVKRHLPMACCTFLKDLNGINRVLQVAI